MSKAITLSILVLFAVVIGSQSVVLALPNSWSQKLNKSAEDSGLKIRIITIEGGEILAEDFKQKLIKDWIGQEANLVNLEKITEQINNFYLRDGYTTSGAYLSNVRVELGWLRIVVVEGEIEEIQVQGLEHLSKDYVVERLQRGIGKPFNWAQMEQTLKWMKLDEALADISAEIRKGSEQGKNILFVKVKENKRFRGTFQTRNDAPPTIGTFYNEIRLKAKHLLISGDEISVGYGITDGSDNFDLTYSLLVNSNNTRFLASCGTGRGDIVEQGLEQLNIDSDARYCYAGVTHPIFETYKEGVYAGASLGFQNAESSVLDNPFRLSRGADEKGRTRIRPLRIYQAYVFRSSEDFFFIANRLNFGLPFFGGTINNDGTPDSRFFYYSAEGQYFRRWSDKFDLIIRGRIQLSPISLPSVEQFRLASWGRGVRGYRESFLISDSGLFLSLESRFLISKFESSQTAIKIATFFDTATGWNTDDLDIAPSKISSVGLGLIWETKDSFSAGLYWAYPLAELERKKNSWQEQGFYLFLKWSFF